MRNLLFFLILVMIKLGYGSLPETKIYNKQKDLIDGQINGISVTSEGELVLAPAIKQIFDSERLFIWDVVMDNKGNFIVVTGDGVKIYRIDQSGQSVVLSQWEDRECYSIAIDNQGLLYAATSPDGKIYRLGKNNKPELFCQLEVKYIWDMLFDEQNRCYVATGDSGVIYVINSQGTAAVFYQSNETHIRCLVRDKNKQLLAGSYPSGYLYRFNAAGQAFVVYDSDFQELHQICLAKDGTIYAAALGQEEPKATSDRTKSEESTSFPFAKNIPVISVASRPADGAKTSKSGVIKVQPDGVIKNIWTQASDQVQAIILTQDQSLLVGTSDKGRLYKISPDENSTLLFNVDASQIVSFVDDGTGTMGIATSNLGRIFLLMTNYIKQGSYESPVFDANTLTHWGSIQYDEELPPGCDIRLYTRSGNTEKPTGHWSPWVILTGGGSIKSPTARFLQWKLELKTDDRSRSPAVKNLKISYLQQNLPPEVAAITVHPVEKKSEFQPVTPVESPALEISLEEPLTTESQKQPLTPGARPPLQDGYRRVTWQARDKNNDQLAYTLYFQPKDDKNWWLLKEDLTKASYTWDSRMLPEGYYRLKVVADDRRSNSMNTAKQAEKISDWFIIDNTGPKVENLKATKINRDSLQISFRVIDELSKIKQVQFSYDVQKWWWVYPLDLVCDSRQEDFQVHFKVERDNFHSIVIKATDEADNKGYGRATIKE